MPWKEHEEVDIRNSPIQLTVFRHIVAMLWFFKQQIHISLSMPCTIAFEYPKRAVGEKSYFCTPVHSIESPMCRKYDAVSRT